MQRLRQGSSSVHYPLTKLKLLDLNVGSAINVLTSAKNTTKNTKRKPRKTRPLTSGVTVKEAFDMRILQLHSNFIVFKPVEKEINIAEEAEKVENRVEEVVVLFTAIEEGDNSAMAQKAINDVRAFLGKLKVNRILIYPFAHLSSNLSQPSEALKIIKDMEAYAKEKGIETYRAPFGWNKQFTISIKGHPLAEQARSYAPAPAAATAEATLHVKPKKKKNQSPQRSKPKTP